MSSRSVTAGAVQHPFWGNVSPSIRCGAALIAAVLNVMLPAILDKAFKGEL
jgi:hypothetical protein